MLQNFEKDLKNHYKTIINLGTGSPMVEIQSPQQCEQSHLPG